jgi:hypothetical protein
MKQWWIDEGGYDFPAELESSDQYDESNKDKQHRIDQKLEFADQPHHSLTLCKAKTARLTLSHTKA